MANYHSPKIVEKIGDWLAGWGILISSQSLNSVLPHLLSSVLIIRIDHLNIS